MSIVRPGKEKRAVGVNAAVALYGRVSTEKQAENGTIRAQKSVLREYATKQNLTVAGEYFDEAHSGTQPLASRVAGAQLLADAKAGKFGTVLCYKIDRLGRDTEELLAAAKSLAGCGAVVQSLTETFDQETPFGRFQFALMSSLAEMDRSMVLEKLWRGRMRRASEGYWGGGALPFGYELDAEHKLIPATRRVDPPGMTEAELVADIITRIAQGSTSTGEAQRLNRLGVPTERRYTTGRVATRQARAWHPSKIGALVHNPLYSGDGTLHTKRGDMVRRVPPLVSPEIQARAQAVLAGNKSIRANQAGARCYVLRGWVFCGVCGRRCAGAGGNKAGLSYHYYRCAKANTPHVDNGQPACPARAVRADWLEQMVWSYCRELILDPAKAEAYLAAYDTAQAPTTSTLEAEASAYRTRLAQLQHERERVQDLHRTRPDLMDLTELERQLGILATHKREVQAALTTSEQALAAVVQPTHPFRDAAAVLTSLQHETIALGETPTPAEQRDVLNHLTPRVTIHLTDDTPRAGASTVTIRLFGRSPFRADSVTSNSIDMSSEESYTHVQALPTLTHEQRSANARKAQVTKRAHGIALGPTPRLNAAQTQALLADRAQGMTTVTLAAKYGESRRFVWHVLQRHGDPLPPVSLTYSHLSPEQIQALVGDRAAGMTHRRLAAAYGVSKDYVATVLRREGDPTRQPSTQCSLPFKEAV